MEKFCPKTIIIGKNSMQRNSNTSSDNQRRQGIVTVLLVNSTVDLDEEEEKLKIRKLTGEHPDVQSPEKTARKPS